MFTQRTNPTRIIGEPRIMSKELEALERIKSCLRTGIDECEEELNLVETALKEKEQQDNIISIIKETIEFNIQEPEIEVKENGEISLLSRVGMCLRKQLNEKEKELFREWVLKECFLEELKALEIIKKKEVNVEWLLYCDTVEEYNFGFFKGKKNLITSEFDVLQKELTKGRIRTWVK